ncbi:ribosomal protein S5 domain 2-type protein [Halteromyces radiatus]|uniref:ribosomal protein S5 domain 2-type protein n=1 Tax=Halteromyces radiatus TaxID=101107 RepID=UPI00221EA7A4|nr:ribosomal protein S5 domain 2-type protein [Halteromyces radiatus]KAI8097719.1 ribosomal protein S5 domain 2-type protein [Halteromyces radiatus]
MDRKRVTGPELSVPPLFKKSTVSKNILNEKNRRLDDRTIHDLRPIFMKTGLVTQSNGSTYIEMGNTKLVCAVYGPRQLKKTGFSPQGILNCEFKFSTFSCTKRRGHMRDAQEREYSNTLIQALTPAVRLELFPKSAVDIYVNVLENDGTNACLATAIIAASMALADAGIEMLDQVTACSAVFSQKSILMDGTDTEEKQQDGALMLSYMPSLNQVTHILQAGRLENDDISKAMEQCIDGCSKIYSVMSAALLESLN